MKRTVETRGLQRMDLIFAGLRQGKTASDIDAMLADQRKQERQAMRDKGGHKSELHVENVLSGLSYVDSARRTQRNGEEDISGVDIVVYFNERMVEFPFTNVSVQVKSTERHLKAFKRVAQERLKNSGQNVDDALKRKRLILINGRNSQEDILKSFEEQLHGIAVYHAERR